MHHLASTSGTGPQVPVFFEILHRRQVLTGTSGKIADSHGRKSSCVSGYEVQASMRRQATTSWIARQTGVLSRKSGQVPPKR
ncbi:MAG: hypothetical protein KDB01_24305, partial [Planctomycetaceae bacterium]|nr:hypothetical protein [Planctomycetaceae bacterium]